MNLLNCLGVGIVANNKELDTDEIFVYLPSQFPQQDGEIVAIAEEVKVENKDIAGNTESSKLLEGNAVPAKWMRLDSNRITAPDVRVGSKVAVYQWKNQPKYFWTYIGTDGTMRLETVIWAFSASPNVNENSPITSDNYYLFMVSSHQKKIQMLTGQGNGEAMALNVTFDLGEGYVGLGDNLDNLLVFNSVEKSLTYANADLSQLSVNKKDISMYCKGNGTWSADERIDIKTKSFNLESQYTTINSSDTIDISTNSFGIKASSLNADIPNTIWKGDFKLNGGLHASGKIKTDKDIEFGNTSGSKHTHTGVRTGDGNTGPVSSW